MTAAFHDDVTPVAPVRPLRVVRDTDRVQAPEKAARPAIKQPIFAGDPLVEGATRLLSIPLRHVYAALWRVGVLEVQA